MVLRTRLHCPPRILGRPARLVRRDSRGSGMQAPGGRGGGDWLFGATWYGYVYWGVLKSTHYAGTDLQ